MKQTLLTLLFTSCVTFPHPKPTIVEGVISKPHCKWNGRILKEGEGCGRDPVRWYLTTKDTVYIIDARSVRYRTGMRVKAEVFK